MPAPDTVRRLKAQRAAFKRSRSDDDPEVVIVRRDLNAANLEAAVLRALAKAPRPSDEQLQRVAALLLAGAAR
jgi:hypothetical protein